MNGSVLPESVPPDHMFPDPMFPESVLPDPMFPGNVQPGTIETEANVSPDSMQPEIYTVSEAVPDGLEEYFIEIQQEISRTIENSFQSNSSRDEVRSLDYVPPPKEYSGISSNINIIKYRITYQQNTIDFVFNYYPLDTTKTDKISTSYEIEYKKQNGTTQSKISELSYPGFLRVPNKYISSPNQVDDMFFFIGSSRDLPYERSDNKIQTNHLRHFLPGIYEISQIERVHVIFSGIELGRKNEGGKTKNIVTTYALAAYECVVARGDGTGKNEFRVNVSPHNKKYTWISFDKPYDFQLNEGTNFETETALCVPRIMFRDYMGNQNFKGVMWMQPPRAFPMFEPRLLKFTKGLSTEEVWERLSSQFALGKNDHSQWHGFRGYEIQLNPDIDFGVLTNFEWKIFIRKKNVVKFKKRIDKYGMDYTYVFAFPDVICEPSDPNANPNFKWTLKNQEEIEDGIKQEILSVRGEMKHQESIKFAKMDFEFPEGTEDEDFDNMVIQVVQNKVDPQTFAIEYIRKNVQMLYSPGP